jgi:dUTPase
MVKFLVIGPTKAPQRKPGDAGFDIFMPENTERFRTDFEAKNPDKTMWDWTPKGIRIMPHGRILVPSYLKTLLPYNVELEMNNKSGVANAKGVIYGSQIVDPSYEGISHVSLINTDARSQEFEFNTKIIQAVPKFFDTDEHTVDYTKESGYPETTTEAAFFEGHDSAHRGDKGFGQGTGLV